MSKDEFNGCEQDVYNVFAAGEEGTDPLGCYGQIPVPFVSEDNAVICSSKVEVSCDGRTVILKIKGLDGKDELRHQSCESLPYSVSVIFE